MAPSLPQIKRLIGLLLEEHRHCESKKHQLAIRAGNIILTHKDQVASTDTIIASLDQKKIRLGLTSKQWNQFAGAIFKVLSPTPGNKQQSSSESFLND